MTNILKVIYDNNFMINSQSMHNTQLPTKHGNDAASQFNTGYENNTVLSSLYM